MVVAVVDNARRNKALWLEILQIESLKKVCAILSER